MINYTKHDYELEQKGMTTIPLRDVPHGGMKAFDDWSTAKYDDGYTGTMFFDKFIVHLKSIKPEEPARD